MTSQQKDLILGALRKGMHSAAQWYAETGSLTSHEYRREIDAAIKVLDYEWAAGAKNFALMIAELDPKEILKRLTP